MITAALSVSACGGNETTGGTTGGGSSSSSSTSAGGTGGGSAAALTLDNCTTTVGDGVPAFWKTYFKCVDISVSGTDLVIATKGLPPHKSYYYGKSSPNYEDFDTTRGTGYKPNPNVLSEQDVTVQFPIDPTPKDGKAITADQVNGNVDGPTAGEFKLGPAGVGLDGVLLFNPLAAPGDKIETEKFTFDIYNAHPEKSGAYHYHTTSKGPLEVLAKIGVATKTEPGSAEVEIYGVMCDGTVVMGCTEVDGSKPDTTGLDAQNGHVHDVKAKDGTVLLAGRYHTHICTSFTDATHQFTPEIQYYKSCVAK